MGYKNAMTHEEHVILGKALSNAKRVLQNAHIALSNNIGKTDTTTKNVLKARISLEKACCELDALYHSVTTEEQFEKHGHVYYGGKPNE
jgi:hypothetical protein